MAAVRAVWLLRRETAEASPSPLLFCRRFPTVERRARSLHGIDYATLPADPLFASQILAAIDTKSVLANTELPAQRVLMISPPVYAVGPVWPVVVLEESGFVLAALPLVARPQPEPGLVTESASISAAVCLGEDVLRLVLSLRSHSDDTLCNELQTYFSLAAPFGTPAQLSYIQLGQLMMKKGDREVRAADEARRPAWRPAGSSGKLSLDVELEEVVDASQYDNETTPDVMYISGVLKCKAELPGTPEVSLPLKTVQKMRMTLFNDHCVQEFARGKAGADILLRYIPPVERAELLTYRAPTADLAFPIRGFYQMMEEDNSAVKLLLQLKCSDALPNIFDKCEVRLPFFNRGGILKAEAQPIAGQVSVSDTRHELVWKIGRSFPTPGRELSLSATVFFAADTPHKAVDDPFCTGQNAYVRVEYVVPSFTLSGLAPDVAAIKVDPLPPKLKLKPSVAVRLVSGDYLIWNSLGKARTCATTDSAPLS